MTLTISLTAWAQASVNACARRFPTCRLQALVEGLQQAYQGKPLALKDEQIEQILAEHEAQVALQSPAPQSEVALEKEQRFLSRGKSQTRGS